MGGDLPSTAASSDRNYTVYIAGGIMLAAAIGAWGWYVRRKYSRGRL